MLHLKLQTMSELIIPIADVDDAVAGTEVGKTIEVYASFKVISKDDSEIVVEVSDVEKCEDIEEGDDEAEGDEEEEGDMKSKVSNSSYEEDDSNISDSKPTKRGKKGMGILIMVGGSKKK